MNSQKISALSRLQPADEVSLVLQVIHDVTSHKNGNASPQKDGQRCP
jgi:hypothetical protein